MRGLAAILIAAAAAACTVPREIPAPPPETYEQAALPGFEGMRFWGDVPPADLEARMEHFRSGLVLYQEPSTGEPTPIDVLLLSGGGSDGAFGAGLLKGWTEAGTRPEFKLVTGISTGAIIAPFAFIGPKYDSVLEEIYTKTNTDGLVIFTPLAGLLGRALAITDTAPFARKLEELITPDLVAEIAEGYRGGRNLLIGTTNLDAQRPVIWDIGEIAASGHPDAPDLIRRIILASSAIPGAFPPVLFKVSARGETFTEVHADGGVTRQIFYRPPGIEFPTLRQAIEAGRARGTIYAIRNTKLAPDFQNTELGVLPIAARSVSTLIKYGGVADMRIVAAQAATDGLTLHVAAVPESFAVPENELFDPVYMTALFDLGRRLALDGSPWHEVEID